MLGMWDADPEKRPTFSGVVQSFKKRHSSFDMSEDQKNVLAAALGEKVEEKTGLMGLSAHHINKVVKKFMKVSKMTY